MQYSPRTESSYLPAIFVAVFVIVSAGISETIGATESDPRSSISITMVGTAPRPDGSARFVITSETPLDGFIVFSNGDPVDGLRYEGYDHPPYAKMFETKAPSEEGEWTVGVVRPETTAFKDDGNAAAHRSTKPSVAALRVDVIDAPSPAKRLPDSGVWEIEREWDGSFERLFSFWVAHLFRPLDGQRNKGWKTLHNVLRSETRNFLHNSLGFDEDSSNGDEPIMAIADCGDLPYQLRAYFSWKFGLPFRFRECDRGTSRRGPSCRRSIDNRVARYDHIESPVGRFNAFLQKSIAWEAHSGTMRTLPEDPESDFYPIALSYDSIRPGTVFVDIGGHALMVSQWNGNGLFAVDGHPDKTVTRRKFCSKYFRPFSGVRTGGFKAFRPIVIRDDKIVPVSDEEFLPSFSLEQYLLANKTHFYETMDRLIRVL